MLLLPARSWPPPAPRLRNRPPSSERHRLGAGAARLRSPRPLRSSFLQISSRVKRSGSMVAATSSNPSTPARILIVEDQPDVRRMLVTALEIEGHHVDEASNAREGLERL